MKPLFPAFCSPSFRGFGAANAAADAASVPRVLRADAVPNGGVRPLVAPRVVRPIVVVPRARVFPDCSRLRYDACRRF